MEAHLKPIVRVMVVLSTSNSMVKNCNVKTRARVEELSRAVKNISHSLCACFP